MAVTHLIGIGAGIVGLTARGGTAQAAKEVADLMLCGGLYQTVIGNDQLNCIGGRTTHVYGDDVKLTFGNSVLGPYLGLFLAAFNKKALVAGVNGDVQFDYGQKVNLVYGGPIAQITRGPVIQKTNFRQLATQATALSVLDVILTAPKSLGANQPKAPAVDDAPTVNLRAFDPEIDAKYEKPILACSMLMTAMTTAVDLAIRFKYPDYNADLSQGSRPDPMPTALRDVTRILTDVCMGLIYHMELLSIHDNNEAYAQSEASNSLATATALTATAATSTTAQILAKLKRAMRFLAVMIYNTILLALVAAVVVAIAAAIALLV